MSDYICKACEHYLVCKHADNTITSCSQHLELVHCKYCKHWLKDVAGCTYFVGRCKWANYMIGAAGYCVYGERKNNES